MAKKKSKLRTYTFADYDIVETPPNGDVNIQFSDTNSSHHYYLNEKQARKLHKQLTKALAEIDEHRAEEDTNSSTVAERVLDALDDATEEQAKPEYVTITHTSGNTSYTYRILKSDLCPAPEAD